MDIIVRLPDIGTSEVEVVEILVQDGSYVKKEQGLLNVEGQKSSIEIPSPKNGIIKKFLVKIGEKVKKNTKICILTIKKKNKLNFNDTKNTNVNKKNNNLINNNPIKKNSFFYASPLVRRLVRINDIKISKVIGTGRNGRIIRKDITKYIKKNNKKVNEISNNKSSCDFFFKKYNFSNFGEIENIKLSNLQKNIISNLDFSWKNIPHVTHFDEIDVTQLEKFRIQYNEDFSLNNYNNKITLLPFILKIIAKVLENFPNFNSSLDLLNDNIIFKKYINIGIVINTKFGLFIPVLKNLYKKNILNIAKEINIFSKKAHCKKLSILDMSGGSFTISNLGKFGRGFFTPIINYPEVAILGISRILCKYYINNNKKSKKFILPVSLSYDHRVINGVEAGNFLSFMSEIISDIRYLLM